MKIKQLLVVAGPTAAGKSLFLKRLTQQTSNELSDQLTLGFQRWQQVNARQFDSDAPRPFPGTSSDHIGLHYEITRTWKRPYDHAGDPGLELLQFAEKRIFVTLWAPADVLRERLVGRDIRSWRRRLSGVIARWPGKPSTRKQARRIDFSNLYRAGVSELEQIYQGWFRFCADFSSDDHWLLDTSAANGRVRQLDHASLQSGNCVTGLLRGPSQAA